MSKVLYPGTFDPITNGHLDIIQRSAKLFDHVLIAVAANPTKKPLLELPERVQLIQQSIQHLSNVEVIGFSELLAKLAHQQQIHAIIRGVRTTADFEYELQLAQLNRLLTSQLGQSVETIFFPSADTWSYLSSTMVREIFLHQGDISPLVPPVVAQVLMRKRLGEI